MVLVVKIQYLDVLRRRTFPALEPLTLKTLNSTIAELFDFPDHVGLKYSYTDNEGDEVVLAGDDDLKDAVQLQRLNPLRLLLKEVVYEKAPTDIPGLMLGFVKPSPEPEVVEAKPLSKFTPLIEESLKDALYQSPKVVPAAGGLSPLDSLLKQAPIIAEVMEALQAAGISATFEPTFK
eukprot:TRINITY_DN32451_c0_g1_i1.p1 TRINITY_DN32451_c0_g1~~TRINITY_DN32451_c0_g1_i1.p1  ORF type:complete len:178 (-),score=27.08 TRINITY_DN32451_c0_g1_i1:700-1233(-)